MYRIGVFERKWIFLAGITVLICDDNESVHNSLTPYLTEQGLQVRSVYNGEEALKLFRSQRVDLIVLDIMLPGISGTEVCKAVRRSSSVPIIMLSAKSEEFDRILGLEFGADDYMTKPFSPRELSIKIRNILRRQQTELEEEKLSFRELVLYPGSMEVFIGGEKQSFTAKEVKVLMCFLRNAGKVLSRDQILNTVWGYEYCSDSRVVDTMVKRVRQKLPAEGVHFAIRSVYGVGYKLEEVP